MNQGFVKRHNTIAPALVKLYSSLNTSSPYRDTARPSKEKVSYPYIPSSGNTLQTVLDYLKVASDLRILKSNHLQVADLGCGDGLFISFVKSYICEVIKTEYVKLIGVESNEKIIPANKQMDIRYQDFFTLTSREIGSFDIIYTYNPLVNPKDNLKLINYIIPAMKNEAIFIYTNFSLQSNSLEELGFVQVGMNVYVFQRI